MLRRVFLCAYEMHSRHNLLVENPPEVARKVCLRQTSQFSGQGMQLHMSAVLGSPMPRKCLYHACQTDTVAHAKVPAHGRQHHAWLCQLCCPQLSADAGWKAYPAIQIRISSSVQCLFTYQKLQPYNPLSQWRSNAQNLFY